MDDDDAPSDWWMTMYRVSLRANAHHCTLSVIVTMKKTLHPMNTELTLSGS